MSECIWKIKEQPENAVENIAKELGVLPVVARLLINRGYNCPEKANRFLKESVNHDPFLMKDMDKAVHRIQKALQKGEKIVVYGDYDADGVTAVCALMLYLQAAGAHADFYIPDRTGEGYGLHTDALEKIHGDGAGLVITVDTGIAATKEIAAAVKNGLDIIVTDHHECKETIPHCCAVLNPRQPDCLYPFKGLAGVGVAYKLIQALDSVLQIKNHPKDSIVSLAAIGTIADIMPLTDENRTLVKSGLDDINLQTSNMGVRALIHASGIAEDKRISETTVGFMLAPRINAAGRIGHARAAAELFLAGNAPKAAIQAAMLCEYNTMRQKIENDIFVDAKNILENEYDPAKDKCIILCKKGWHNGVLGIVASRLAELFNVPCILLAEENSEASGSGRSVNGINLFAALQSCSRHLSLFGGHEMAVGLTLPSSSFDRFKKCINNFLEKEKAYEPPFLDIDFMLSSKDITLETVNAIKELEPFGTENPSPCFALTGGKVLSVSPLSGGRHSKIMIKSEGICFTGLFFGKPYSALSCAEDDEIDIAFLPEKNTFRGQESLNLIIRDIKTKKDIGAGLFETAYQNACKGDFSAIKEYAPDRGDLEAVYRYFTKQLDKGIISHNRFALPKSIETLFGRPMDLCKLLLALDIFCELGIFTANQSDEAVHVRRGNETGKTELSASPLWRALSLC